MISKFLIILLTLNLCLINTVQYYEDEDTCSINQINDCDTFLNIPELGSLVGSTTKTALTRKKIIQFLSIPYAESPSKNLRFKPPVAKRPWRSLKYFTKYGRSCPSISSIPKLTDKNKNVDLEDCLSLCVFTKNLKRSAPVMAFIHPGYFYNGSASDYQPNYLLEQNIVLVVLQYRIGILGFLSTQTKEIPGNISVLDIILGLQWIQKYIQYFGGDSCRVTIFGQSSGAALANLLIISPIVPPYLFDKVIMQSGSIFAPWAITQEPIKIAIDICHKAGCIDCTDIESVNNCMMNLPTRDIIKKLSNQLIVTPSLNDLNGILPKMPKKLMDDFGYYKYQIMIGSTKHDGLYPFAAFYEKLTRAYSSIKYIKPKVFIKFMTEHFYGINDNTGIISTLSTKILFQNDELIKNNYTLLYPGLVDLSSILTFKSPLLHFIDLYSQKNDLKNYLYTFDYSGKYSRYQNNPDNDYHFNDVAYHLDDNLYLFPRLDNKLTCSDYEMIKTMVELWTSFAIYGEPTTRNGLKVLPIESGTGPYFKINNEITIGRDYLDEFTAVTDDFRNKSTTNNKKRFYFL